MFCRDTSRQTLRLAVADLSNASMYSTPNGSGESLEKFPSLGEAPPSITPPTAETILDAGLKNLTHCTFHKTISLVLGGARLCV